MKRSYSFFVIIIVLMVLFSLTPENYAVTGDAGAPGAFLKLGSGVRALSMGRAFVALADDASAAYWNPAGLVQIQGGEISFMYAQPFGKVSGINHQNIGYAIEKKKYFSYGANFIYTGVEDIKGYNDDASSTGNFGSSEWAFLLSLAFPPSPNFAWGSSLKVVSQKIADYQAKGVGLDFGTLLRSRKLPLRFGINIENLVQPVVKLRDTVEFYPRRYHYGLMIIPFEFRRILKTIITADLISQKDTGLKQFYGTEFNLYGSIFLRGGYNTASFEQSFGVGLKLRKLGLDYAYVIHPYLGDTHRAGITLRF